VESGVVGAGGCNKVVRPLNQRLAVAPGVDIYPYSSALSVKLLVRNLFIRSKVALHPEMNSIPILEGSLSCYSFCVCLPAAMYLKRFPAFRLLPAGYLLGLLFDPKV
jgi:hypothetical protein